MLAVGLFGELAIETAGKAVDVPARRPGRLLLAWLALHPGVHARGDVAAALWPDVLLESARGSLRSALLTVRRCVGDEHVAASRTTIGLQDVWVDAVAFRDALAQGDPERAIALHTAPLLQGLDDEWVQRERDACREELGAALADAARRAEEAGDLAVALEHTRRQLALDDLSEPAARDLMRRLAAAGDRSGAVAAYRRLSERLRAELQLAPSFETRRLAAAVRSGEAARATAQRPLPTAVQALLATELVGRRAELAQLEAPAAHLAVVAGETGIGKTRLLAELAARAHGRGAQVLWGACSTTAERAYAPVADALAEDMPPGEGDAARLFAGVDAALQALGGGRRVLLVVDDLQWAGPSTLRLLDHLVRDEAPLTLAIGHRPLAGPAALVVQRWRRASGTASCELGGLDTDDVGRLAERLAGRPAPAALARALAARTAGHPLFVAELVRRFGAAWPPARAIAGEALPVHVAEAVHERIAALDAGAQATLAVAATIGASFAFALLCEVVGDEDATLDALDAAVAAGLLREERAGQYAFAHAIVHETAYGSLTQTRRAHLHRRIAAALERADTPPLRTLALHHLAAAGLGDPATAAEHAVRAAQEATAHAAHEDSVALYEQALAALPAGPAAAARRAPVELALGHARMRAADGAGARESFLLAADMARELGDGALLAEAALGICSVPWFPGSDAVDRAAVGLLERALALLDSPSSPRALRVRAQLVRERYFVAGGRATLAEAERLVAEARAGGDAEALAAALDAWSIGLAGLAGAGTRLAAAEELLRVARAPELQLRARIWRAVASLQSGDWAVISDEEQALERAAAERREPSWRWWPALWRAMRALASDDLEAGEALAVEAWEIGSRPFGERAAVELQTQLAWIRWRQRRFDELEQMTAAAEERYAAIPAWRCVRALVDAECGRHDAARSELRRLSRSRFAALADANRLVALALAAETCRLIGDASSARHVHAALSAHAGEWPVSGYGGLVLAPVDSSLDELAGVMRSSTTDVSI